MNLASKSIRKEKFFYITLEENEEFWNGIITELDTERNYITRSETYKEVKDRVDHLSTSRNWEISDFPYYETSGFYFHINTKSWKFYHNGIIL